MEKYQNRPNRKIISRQNEKRNSIMKKSNTNLLAIFFLISLLVSCQSTLQNTGEEIPLKLAYVFSDHMVLQQQDEVAFWGDYTMGEEVSIAGSWGKSATTKIEDWRANWNHEFPFYYVQIAPYIYTSSAVSQGLRDAQRKTLKTTPKTGMAIIMDIGEKDDIHPTNKQDVGDRLALLALDKDYGQDLVSSGPLYKSHTIFPTYVEVDFDSKGTGLMAQHTLDGFEVAGSDGIFYPATARIVNNKVKVSSTKVSNPKDVRYGWKNWIVGTLFNKEGLPASSFSSI